MSAFTELETLWHEHHAGLVRHAKRYVGPDHAEDLVQDTFCNALKAMLNGKGYTDSARGWLYRIARNLIYDWYRARGRKPAVSWEDVWQRADPGVDVEAQVGLGLEFEQAMGALGQLTEDQRAAVVMRHVEGCEFGEIADALGKNEGAVKSVIYRGLTNANHLLGGDGRPGHSNEKHEAIKSLLCERGPLTIGQIYAATALTHSTVNGIMRGNQKMFVRVGTTQRGAVSAYLWGVAGVHDEEAA